MSPHTHYEERRVRLRRTEAIVLRRRDLGEADRILVLLTKEFGKVRIVAKGVRRPRSRLAGHLELFARTAVLLARGRELDIVTQAQLIDPFLGLREEPWRIGWAGYLADLTDRATGEGEPQPELYGLLLDVLTELARCVDPFPVVRRFEMRLLVLLGYRPELYACVRCGHRLSPNGLTYAAHLGGIVCGLCHGEGEGIALAVGAVKALRLLLGDQWQLVARRLQDPQLRKQVEMALQATLRYQLGGTLASAEVATLLEGRPSGG